MRFNRKLKCALFSVRRRSRTGLLGVAVLLMTAAAFACQVPVFRYALERWNADQYRIVVLHDQPLNGDQKSALVKLRASSEKKDGVLPTTDLNVVDLANVRANKKLDPILQRAWAKRKNTSAPLLLAYYPRANNVERALPTIETPLSSQSVSALLDSPVRRKLVERLQKGDSAVWIFVPCGRKKADNAALARLKKQIAEDQDWLKVPSAKDLEVSPDVLKNVKVPLKIQFSTVTLDRNDPAEKFLYQSLLHSEDDLTTFQDQPMAFPVFGRGRVLYALIGKGIAPDTIRAASSFMAGPCSCQVKNQNPGFDLLLQANWKKALGDVLVSEPVESVNKEALAPKLLKIAPGSGK